ncbi:MAG: hypothetical protein MAG453_01920 [Calditrichaeota bacterium]|nr:hypothetical protein [Calditrichota bacterium]
MSRLSRFAWLTLIVSSITSAQPPDTLWTRTWDYPDDDEDIYCVRPTFDGGLIMCGATHSGPGLNAAWVMRTDADGEEIWSQLNSGGVNDAADYIEQTSDGGFIECGETWSYSPYNDWDGYVRKLDADGNQVWARLLGVDDWLDYALCVREVPAGGYVTFGAVEGVLTVIRLGPNGSIWWTQSYPEWFANAANFIEPTQDGGFLIAVNYFNTHFVVAKLSSTGNLVWYRDFSHGFASVAECIRELPDQSIVACGYKDVNYDGGAYYVVRLEPDGDLIWERTIDAQSSQRAHEIWVTVDGLVVSGKSQAPLSYWFVKFDLDGNTLWHMSLEGGLGFSCCQTKDGDYVFGGAHQELPGDISDAFHIIKTHPEVELTLTPDQTIVPAGGGTLTWDGAMSNILVAPTPLDAWASVTTAGGFTLPLQQVPVTLQPGGSFTVEDVPVYVPGWVPAGEYTYAVHLGAYSQPMNNMGFDEFTFVKEGDGAGGRVHSATREGDHRNAFAGVADRDPLTTRLRSGANVGSSTANHHIARLLTDGRWLAEQPHDALAVFNRLDAVMTAASRQVPISIADEAVLPEDYYLSTYPNPFNSATTILINLPESSELTVDVYNLQGHLVAKLADHQPKPAGRHSFLFDASDLASGVYMVHAAGWTAGSGSRIDLTQKIMLVR